MIDLSFTPAEIASGKLTGHVAVVIDVLRATSTIVEALANGARSVYPVSSIEAAVGLVERMGRDRVLLCGERQGLPIDGFDLGNSPREYTPDRVRGKSLILTTTNGTPALLATSMARSTLVASFLNLSAVIEEIRANDSPVMVVCAGRERRFSLDDAVCGGALVQGLIDGRSGEWGTDGQGGGSVDGVGASLPDGARVATELAGPALTDLETLFASTAAGRQLIDAGLGEDLAFCAQLDRHQIVPRFHDGQVTL